MAMVHQLTEGEVTNRNTVEDGSHASEHSGDSSSRPSSRSSGRSRRSTPGLLPQYQYSREELVKISKLPSSQKRPNCLDVSHNNTTGKWDPERWFVNKRGDKQLPPEEPRSKRERQEVDVGISHKRRPSDPKERIKEEKDEIVLSPQRRSFGTGCHVIQQSSLARRPGSPSDNRESENYREPSRRIGSGRIISRDRDQREWDRDHRDYGYSGGRNERRDRFDQDDGEKEVRRYSTRYGRGDRRISRGRSGDRIAEEEPEWFSGGPTSQSETIELVGFDDAPNDDDRKSKKVSGRKSKENSRRQSLVSEDGDKIESSTFQEGHPPRRGNQLLIDLKTNDNSKPSTPEPQPTHEPEDSKSVNTNFDLDELFRMEWIPGLLPNGALPDRANNEIGCSRFSQWFKRDSPILGLQGSGENSRRSSLQDELIAHVFSGIGEPNLLIPSPTPSSSESYFTPISPALPHSSPNYTMPPSHTSSSTTSKNILEMLQTANINNNESMINGDSSKNIQEKDVTEKAKSVEQLEADLKRIVLGDKGQLQEDRSAFDKLLRHMTEASSSPPSSISMGPLDKSKALQEEDLLQNILGRVSSPQPPPSLHSQALLDDKSLPPPGQHPGLVRPQYLQQPQPPQNDMFAQLLQQQHQQRLQQQQQLQQSQQQQLQQSQQQLQQTQQQQQQGMNVPGLTVDMLAKLLGTQPHPQPPVSPISPGLHQSSTVSFNNRNEQQALTALLQQKRQRELISSLIKQQQQQPPPQPQPPQPPQVIAQPPIIQHRCPSSKEIVPGSVPQTLGIPSMTGGLSPRQSPLPSDAISSAIPNQGRIPSPLVFGQQPPALSHAPAPIHPAHLAQAMAQNVTTNSNTLQVQNALVLQRVPSPQELAVHTQSILQNALIKRKLEEQKENFRKRQEAQRTSSPSVTNNNNKNGVSTSPLKGLSPTMAAFTPTSVMRKMHSEKLDKDIQSKTDIVQNGCSCAAENRSPESGPNGIKTSNMATSTSSADGTNASANNNDQPPHTSVGSAIGPRPVHGQGVMNQPRSQQNSLSATPSIIIPGQGRPIVKGGSGQIGVPSGSGGDLSRTTIGASKGTINHNKHFLLSNPQAHPLHPEISPTMDTVAKFMEQQRILQQQQAAALAAQRQQNTSPMPPLHTATFALGPRGPQHPLIRPMNIGPTASASTLNFPFLRAFQASPAMRAAQACSLNPLSQLGQLAALQQQLQRGTADSRQIQALAQARGLHPLALQQLLLNAQTQAAAAQVQVAAGLAGARGDGKHQHLIPGQGPTNRQSPVNLAKWFGNDVLKQKMPEMPPVSHQKALLVEEVERQQQQSATVHN